MSSVDSEHNENLRAELIAYEDSLSDVMLAEYFKRRRFVESALEDYITNSAEVEQLQQDRNRNYVESHNLSVYFLYASIIFIGLILGFDFKSAAITVGYILISLVVIKKYIDIKHDDVVRLGNIVLCQMEIQRINRDLSMYGVSEADVICFKVERDLIKYRNEADRIKTDEDMAAQSQRLYSIELRMAHQVCEGMRTMI
jgi:hypothetical protein